MFAAGLFLGLNNLVYMVEFIKGVAQPVLILFGIVALASAVMRPGSPLRKFNLVIGLISLPLGIYGVYDEYYATMDFLRGVLPVLLVAVGLVVLSHGIGQVRRSHGGEDHDI